MVSHVGTKLVVCAECSDYLGGVREYADNATIGDAVSGFVWRTVSVNGVFIVKSLYLKADGEFDLDV